MLQNEFENCTLSPVSSTSIIVRPNHQVSFNRIIRSKYFKLQVLLDLITCINCEGNKNLIN